MLRSHAVIIITIVYFFWIVTAMESDKELYSGERRQLYHYVRPSKNDILPYKELLNMTAHGIASFNSTAECYTAMRNNRKIGPPFAYFESSVVYCENGYSARIGNFYGLRRMDEDREKGRIPEGAWRIWPELGRTPEEDVVGPCKGAMRDAHNIARSIEVDMEHQQKHGDNYESHFERKAWGKWNTWWENNEYKWYGLSMSNKEPYAFVFIGKEKNGCKNARENYGLGANF